MEVEVQQLGGVDELSGESQILARRRGIAARMIVDEDHGGGPLSKCRAEDFPRVDERRRHNDLAEADEANNTRASAAQVTLAPRPDLVVTGVTVPAGPVLPNADHT